MSIYIFIHVTIKVKKSRHVRLHYEMNKIIMGVNLTTTFIDIDHYPLFRQENLFKLVITSVLQPNHMVLANRKQGKLEF